MFEKKITINKMRVIIFVLLFAFFEPSCISDLAYINGGFFLIIHYIIAILRYSGICCIVLLFSIKNINKISLYTWLLLALQIFYLVICYMHNKSGVGSSNLVTSLIIFILSGCMDIFHSKDTNYVCDILKSVFKWLIIFNFISIIIFPNGMYYDAVRDFPENYFLGFKNQHIYYFLAYFVFDFKDNVMTINKKFDFKEVIIDVMMLLSSLISGATTSFFILIIIIIMKKLIVKISAINPVFMLFISFGVSIFLVLSSFQKSIVNSLDMYFGKDGSLFHRTSIWKMSVLCIAKSPVWGNGNIDVPLKWSWDVGQCHNKYIDLLFVGGIIYFIVYLIFVLIACHDARILSKKFNLNIFSFALYGLFILYIVEANRTEFISFTIFALIHYLKRTLNNKTNDKFLRKARYE